MSVKMIVLLDDCAVNVNEKRLNSAFGAGPFVGGAPVLSSI